MSTLTSGRVGGTPGKVNPILLAFREHVIWDEEFGPEEDMELSVLDQWVHWMTYGDQEVSDDPEDIQHAEQVIFRLAHCRKLR